MTLFGRNALIADLNIALAASQPVLYLHASRSLYMVDLYIIDRGIVCYFENAIAFVLQIHVVFELVSPDIDRISVVGRSLSELVQLFLQNQTQQSA